MASMESVKIKRALVSVTDKSGIAEFCRALADEFGVEIVSTGGTAAALAEAGVPVRPIDDLTGFPEMMDGRVKTLHPRVHGGLLARRDSAEHMAQAEAHGIGMIDMVVVNLYAFEATVAREGVTLPEAVENIDIGGPSMLRSAAKNFDAVTVVTDPASYEEVLAEMRENGGATHPRSRRLASARACRPRPPATRSARRADAGRRS
jgi:phosphoribosylaminoimidazolecarboxamide formyltransferase/IMP cyclohydrolase